MIGSTCAPYLAGWLPAMGEYFVTTESSNVLYCNSILGARGYGGGGNTTFCAAICGCAPKWGLCLLYTSCNQETRPKLIKNIHFCRVGLAKIALGNDIFQVIKPADKDRIIVASVSYTHLILLHSSWGMKNFS